ncbi:hypothetical protein TRFO_25496 [Tritrichomonas foetus]|uniref:Uncharacterized protein n=1 Tax=Tritrichomonas foetus TaxID=1144522 RepID=A0A1J4KAI7_9EUKA|nr:hypothetical protein TRFO_25496 [Tritrichomonas foetus]|eukprot:OHT06469.1 hypothetical protein TRFO_25496 [Tritrichomonas foetus]
MNTIIDFPVIILQESYKSYISGENNNIFGNIEQLLKRNNISDLNSLKGFLHKYSQRMIGNTVDISTFISDFSWHFGKNFFSCFHEFLDSNTTIYNLSQLQNIDDVKAHEKCNLNYDSQIETDKKLKSEESSLNNNQINKEFKSINFIPDKKIQKESNPIKYENVNEDGKEGQHISENIIVSEEKCEAEAEGEVDENENHGDNQKENGDIQTFTYNRPKVSNRKNRRSNKISNKRGKR